MSQCHSNTVALDPTINRSIALIGNPNVGKSVLFQRLTGRYVAVSNYPGTTVEITRGAAHTVPNTAIIDTPGIVAFPPRSEDEEVVSYILLRDAIQTLVQVGDAKNLRRTLLLTIQLAEMGVPLVLVLNMIDEASARGIRIDHHRLSQKLGVAVIPTIATRGHGVEALNAALVEAATPPHLGLEYGPELETALTEIQACLPSSPIAPRALALLWLSGDSVATTWIEDHVDEPIHQALIAARTRLQARDSEPLSSQIQRIRLNWVEALIQIVLQESSTSKRGFANWLGRQAIHPVWGMPLLAVILYGFYWFVGIFGAGTLVGLLENNLFGEILTPWITDHLRNMLPSGVADFLVGEYGLWTMGVTYALALIFPIVTTFFITFGILEDSGYLSRLAVLSNRMFSKLGLNGKAILPMVLGLGCVTMATMTTRILETKRDRLLVILLLALAVPCSAQLGLVMGMLAGISFTATVIWLGVVVGVLFTVGWLAARLLPGERSTLLIELPPLRLPVASNVLIKTLARLEWYLKEVIPLFLFGTALLFALDKLGVLPWIIRVGEPLVTGWLGLPAEASSAFLLGFLRRDFGATTLFMMQSEGNLTSLQIVTAMVTITLFIPCIASIMMIIKERGARTAAAMSALIFPLAFFVGGIIYRVLLVLGWQ